MAEHEISTTPAWKMDAHQPFYRWTCSCGAVGESMFGTPVQASRSGMEHAAAKSDVYTVGDITISRTRHNHGWTLTRENGELVLIGSRWERSSERHPSDVMRFFAYQADAWDAANADYAARMGGKRGE